MIPRFYSKIFLIIIFGFAIVFLSNCEGFKCANGFVYDSVTKEPIDSVLCHANSGYNTIYTDSLGAFDVCNRMGSCNFGCKDISVTFSKKGYKTKVIENPNNEIKEYLDKE